MKKNITRNLIVVGLIVTMGACASTHAVAPDTSQAASSIQAAKQAGAQQYAPVRIDSATHKMKRAKTLIKQEKYEKASQLIRQATVDAKLAMNTTRSKKTQESVNQLKGSIQELEREMSDMNAKMTSNGAVLTFGKMLFNFDKATLQAGGLKTALTLARFLKEHPDLKVQIEGYTDNTGPKEYNRQLSERRANSVKKALVNNGVSSSRIQAVGYGEQYPVASNSTSAGRQLNRRVEIVVSKNNEPNEPQLNKTGQQDSTIIMKSDSSNFK